ncbi:MAG: helix-turn-helix transcriptional regulator [Spirochaetales bacterium]
MATDLSRLLGANIKAFRRALGITQEALAAKVGLSTPYLNLLESGKKFPSEQKLSDLALGLGIRPYELFLDPLVDSQREELVSAAVSEDFLDQLAAKVRQFTDEYRQAHAKKSAK